MVQWHVFILPDIDEFFRDGILLDGGLVVPAGRCFAQ